MGSGFSSLLLICNSTTSGPIPSPEPNLGDLPESVIGSVLIYLNPQEICRLAALNRAFRSASMAEFVWESKLPKNYEMVISRVFEFDNKKLMLSSNLCKKEIYARLSRPNFIDGGTKVGFKQVQKAKDLALTQVEEERCLKETAESTIKRRYESLRSKIELDFQRYKDDLQRLEQELTRIKTSTDPDQQHSTYFPIPVNPYGSHHLNNGGGGEGETIARMLNESDEFDDGIDRACILCSRDEVSVVFLPCAHQVLCVGCNDGYGKKGKAKCPACRVPIEQRIRVFGASS